jgi:exopolysaccharide biosynthesis polyprenyl glycosylphosphotransferase
MVAPKELAGTMLRYNTRYQAFLVLSDALIVAAMLTLSSRLRVVLDIGAPGMEFAFATPAWLYPVAIAVWWFAFQQAGVYSAVDSIHFRPSLRRVISGHIIASLLFVGVLYVANRDYSRLQAFYVISLILISVIAHRFLLRLLRGVLSPYINHHRGVIIVGANPIGARLARRIACVDQNILQVHGFVRLPTDDPEIELNSDAPILGDIDDLEALIQQTGASEVVIAIRWLDDTMSDLIQQIMVNLESYPVNIRLAPDYSSLAYFRATSEYFDDMILIGLREPVLTPMQRILKRLFDIAFSSAVLLLSWPLFVIIAIAIKLDSPGPVIFRQTRVGQHGRKFTIYKFRTMHINAEEMVRHDPTGQFIKRPDDPRVTRVGRLLRRTSLDELPQFVNVLRGEMSIVGPRPEVLSLAERYEWWQRKRFEVPQGITGWWQITGRSDKPMHMNTEDDLFYISNYSIWLDVKIVARTVISVITGRGAY